MGGSTFEGLVFERLVEVFVGVEFGAVAGQVVHLDAFLVVFEPVFDGAAVVDAEVVDDEDRLAFAVLDQLAQEADKEFGI